VSIKAYGLRLSHLSIINHTTIDFTLKRRNALANFNSLDGIFGVVM
jgi:hypothetical protein